MAPPTPEIPPTAKPSKRGLVPSIAALIGGFVALSAELYLYFRAAPLDAAGQLHEGGAGCGLFLLACINVFVGPAVALAVLVAAIFGFRGGRRALPLAAVIVNLAVGVVWWLCVQLVLS